MSGMETKARGDSMGVTLDRKSFEEIELLIRFHETQTNIDRTTDAEMVQQLEERKKEINEQLATLR